MDDLLKQRIERRLASLPDDKAQQVLDYIDFLHSKYGDRASQPSTLERIADRVEDTMRAGRMSVSAIKGTREVLDSAGRVMQGLADAGRSMLDELQAPSTKNADDGPASDDKATDTGEDVADAGGSGEPQREGA